MGKGKIKQILRYAIPFLAFIVIFGFALACGGGEPPTEGVSKAEEERVVVSEEKEAREEPEERVEDVILWSEAKYHIGERATVYGPVISTHYASTSKGQPTFLNIGKPYPDPDRFTVVIWGENRSNFPQAPEILYANKTLYITGLIIEYKGVAEIEVVSPSQIEE